MIYIKIILILSHTFLFAIMFVTCNIPITKLLYYGFRHFIITFDTIN